VEIKMSIRKYPSIWLILLSDAILVNVSTILAFIVRFNGRIPPVNFRAYVEIALWITLVSILVLYFAGLYEKENNITSFDIFYRVSIAISVGFIIIIALSFYLRTLPFPRTVFVISWLFSIVIISAWHSYLFYLQQKEISPRRFLIIGGSPEGKEIVKEIEKQSLPECELAYLVEKEEEQGKICEISTLRKIIEEKKVNEVIVTNKTLSRHKLLKIIFFLELRGISISIVPGLYEIIMGKMEMTHLGDIPLIKLKNKSFKGRNRVLKRIIDLFFSSFFFSFSFPLLLLISIIIKLDSEGPIFYRQERVGEKEKIYKIYKFRSMIKNAEEETGPVFADENDSRITRVGKILRKLRLDEIPQLFNVLKGEMSLVGPRPERPFFVKEFNEKISGYFLRFTIKPGMTGLAQIYGGYDTSGENKLKYDLSYINNWSLGMDLRIMFMTLEVVLRGKGAR